MILFLVTAILLFMYCCLILFYRHAWRQMKVFQVPPDFRPAEKISVIIAARNEAAVLEACLLSITAQTYPAELFEVIVVDDHSSDETASIVRQFANHGVSLLSLADYLPAGDPVSGYKKKAIELGISRAGGTLIVTTDADCLLPSGWLQTLAAYAASGNYQFIAAPVALHPVSGPLGVFQALDFLSLQGITAASVGSRLHMMCNGANLAYRKEAFTACGGFAGIDGVASGDDMLLMYKIFRNHPNGIGYCLSQDAIVTTPPVSGLWNFLQQRIRWASKATYYRDARISGILLLVFLLNCLLILSGAFSFFNTSWLSSWIALILSKTLVELIFLRPVARFFKQQDLLVWFLPAQPFHLIYTVVSGLLGQTGTYQWKGRRVR